MPMPTTPSPNDLTRQQLDELDSLLQRMLSMPATAPAPPLVAPAPPQPTPTTVAPPGWRADPAEPAPRPSFLSANPAEIEEAIPQLAATVTPLSTERVSLAPATGTLRGVDAPALPTGAWSPMPASTPPPLPEPEPEPIALQTAMMPEPPPTMTPRQPLLPVPALVWPVYAVNWLLEAILGLFGPLGELLTSSPMKHLLGLIGLVLLAGAGAWSARGMGWIEFQLPFTLPW